MLRLYDHAWAAVGERARGWLREHLGASSERLAAAIEQGSPAAAEECRRKDWQRFFVDVPEDVSPGPEPSFDETDPFFDYCWAIDATAVRFPAHDGYVYAAFVTFGRQGRVMLLSANGVLPQYGVLPRGQGRIRTLPDDAIGRHRFYVDARPADMLPLGASACKEITVFVWDGRVLEALVDYRYRAFKGVDVVWDGQALEVETKGNIRSFGTCGGCTDLNAVWRLDVTPDGVHEHDLAYDEPLFPLVDDFVTRVQGDTGWQALGSADAARELQQILHHLKCKRPCEFGFVQTSVARTATGAIVTLRLDAGREVQFSIARHNRPSHVNAVYLKDPAK